MVNPHLPTGSAECIWLGNGVGVGPKCWIFVKNAGFWCFSGFGLRFLEPILRIPGQRLAIPVGNLGFPGRNLTLPGRNLTLPGRNLALPGWNLTLPGWNLALPGRNLALPGQDLWLSGGGGRAAEGFGGLPVARDVTSLSAYAFEIYSRLTNGTLGKARQTSSFAGAFAELPRPCRWILLQAAPRLAGFGNEVKARKFLFSFGALG